MDAVLGKMAMGSSVAVKLNTDDQLLSLGRRAVGHQFS